jgi:hypothetical protein
MATLAIQAASTAENSRKSFIAVAHRQVYARPQKQALTVQEAKVCSEIAYQGKVNEVTADNRWRITRDGVFEKFSGFRAVLLRSTFAHNEKCILAFKGTDTSLRTLRSTFDVVEDAITDVWQAGNVNPLTIPAQYLDASRLGLSLYRNYGRRLRVTGHSLGGGLANFVSLKHDIPGAGVNAAPLGIGTVLHILMFGKRKPCQFTHYDNRGEVVSNYAPGLQIGTVCQMQTNAGPIEAHLLSSINVHASMVCYTRVGRSR